MIIVKRPWHAIPDGALVIDPAGRVWQLVVKLSDQHKRPYVTLRDPDDASTPEATPYVDVNAEIETIITDSTLERAVDILSSRFALKRM